MYMITYEMAIELIYRYMEKIYRLNKHKETRAIKLQHLFEMNQHFRFLVRQLEEHGHNVNLLIREIKEKLEKQYLYERIIVHIDGAARGHNDPSIPNVSGIAFTVHGDSQLLHEEAKYLGPTIELPRLKDDPADYQPETVEATNNTVEYMALIAALEYLLEQELYAKEIQIRSDSQMVVHQVNLTSATRAPHLIRLRNCAIQLMDQFDTIFLVHIPREQNTHADMLVNRLLDEYESSENKT